MSSMREVLPAVQAKQQGTSNQRRFAVAVLRALRAWRGARCRVACILSATVAYVRSYVPAPESYTRVLLSTSKCIGGCTHLILPFKASFWKLAKYWVNSWGSLASGWSETTQGGTVHTRPRVCMNTPEDMCTCPSEGTSSCCYKDTARS